MPRRKAPRISTGGKAPRTIPWITLASDTKHTDIYVDKAKWGFKLNGKIISLYELAKRVDETWDLAQNQNSVEEHDTYPSPKLTFIAKVTLHQCSATSGDAMNLQKGFNFFCEKLVFVSDNGTRTLERHMNFENVIYFMPLLVAIKSGAVLGVPKERRKKPVSKSPLYKQQHLSNLRRSPRLTAKKQRMEKGAKEGKA